jgi:hypothetical protein
MYQPTAFFRPELTDCPGLYCVVMSREGSTKAVVIKVETSQLTISSKEDFDNQCDLNHAHPYKHVSEDAI